MDVFTFTGKPITSPASTYVLAGEDDYLRRLALPHLKTLAPDSQAQVVFDGNDHKPQWGDVQQVLETGSMFFDRLLVIVLAADEMVTAARKDIETHLKKPSEESVLILCCDTWPSNTNLAKTLSASTIDCTGIASERLPAWAVWVAREQRKKFFDRAAAVLLIERGGTYLGVLEQEIYKLADYAGVAENITVDDVRAIVADRSSEQVWGILDASTMGKAGRALDVLADQFNDTGGILAAEKEVAMKTVGAIGSQLKKLVMAVRLVQGRGMTLEAAILAAGVNQFFAKKAEEQIRWLGLGRIDRIYDWLIEAALELRQSGVSDRLILERLIVKLATPRQVVKV